jgi:hypothetical protein
MAAIQFSPVSTFKKSAANDNYGLSFVKGFEK